MTEPLRVIHFADLHLGVETGGRPNPSTGLNQRIHDVLDRFDELCETAEQQDVHLVVFAGDAFKHQHPAPTLQSLFAQRIRRLRRAGVGVFLLVGNHDLPKMAALSHPFSIYGALEVEGVVVGERAQVYRVALPPTAPAPEVQVAALPHFSRSELLARLGGEGDRLQERIDEAVAAAVRKLGEEADPSIPAIFAGHCHVNQSQLSTAQNLFGVSELQVTLSSLGGRFPYYALGHVHRKQVLEREPFIAYSGSLERVDFGEGETIRVNADGTVKRSAPEEKGFFTFELVHDRDRWRLGGEPEFRTVDARRFATVKLSVPAGGDPTETILQSARSAGPFDGAFVRIDVTLDASDRGRIRYPEIRQALAGAYDVRIAAQAPEEAHLVRDPRFATRMAEADALEKYLQTKDEWAAERDDLLMMGRALIEEVLT